jgi:hypothetical protein
MSAPQSAVEPTDKLRFRYIAAYFVNGLQCPTTGPVLVFSDAAQGKKLLLTDYSHENLRHIDTKVSIANLILNASFQAKTLDLGEVKNQSPKEQEDRIRRYGQRAAYLLVEASHEQEASAIGQIGESDKREFCLALPNGFVQATRERHKLFIDQAQAFLCFSMPNVSGFEEVGQCVVASHPSGKPLYVLSFGMGTPRLSVLSAVPTDGPKQFADLFQHSSKLAPFQSAFRLAAGSASNARDELRAFLFAFTALEVFINKVFSDHKQRLLAYRKGDLPSGLESHVAEIEQRMREQGVQKTNILSLTDSRWLLGS